MIRRYVIALTLGLGAAAALVGGESLRAGQQSAPPTAHALAGDGRTTTRLPDGRLLAIAGIGSAGPDGGVSLFDPVTQTTVRLTARLLEPRAWHTATILPTGSILIAGGIGADGRSIATAERFDLATESFTPVAMPGASARAGHTATLLTDGRVLVAGGVDERNALATGSEIWNIESGMVADVPGLQPRAGHTATLLADGQVLLTGGTEADSAHAKSDDVFDARSGRGRPVNRPPVEQAARPLIAEAHPANGSKDVGLDANLTVRFSQQVEPDTLGEQSIALSNADGSLPIRVVVAENGRLAFVWPLEPLQAETSYRLTIANVWNTAGVALAGDQVTFTTVKTPRTTQTEESEIWTPDPSNPNTWRTHRPPSPWQSLAALQAEPGVTAVAGQALTLDGRPLSNVTLAVGRRLDAHRQYRSIPAARVCRRTRPS